MIGRDSKSFEKSQKIYGRPMKPCAGVEFEQGFRNETLGATSRVHTRK